MKKYINVKYLLIAAGAVLILAAGSFIYINNKKEDNTAATGTNGEQQVGENEKATEKTDNPQPVAINNPDEGKPTPQITTTLGKLNDVFLTAYYSKEASTSQDGKTVVPAGSIQPYLYPQGSGVYSVQKKVGSTWTDVASNVSYPGHGGIAAAFAGPTEDNIEYRVVRIEDGKAVSASAAFVVKRSDLVEVGVKTYS